MKKGLKLLSIGLAATIWMGLAGTLLVYVVDENGLFQTAAPVIEGDDLPVTDEDLKDKISSLIDPSTSTGDKDSQTSNTQNDTENSSDIENSTGNIENSTGKTENSQSQSGTTAGTKAPATTTAGTKAPSGGTNDVQIRSALADKLLIGNSGSEKSHALSMTSGVQKTTIKAETGTLSDSYTALRFNKKGATATFVMDLSDPIPKKNSEPVILEIQEIHEATTQAFGYTVYVDGKAVYFRTYEQIASAPNQYFIAVERSAISDLSRVEIKLVSESSKPFHIANVRAYTNFYELMETEEVYQKLGINFYSGTSTDNAISTINSWPKDYSMFDTGIMLSLKYMNLNSTEAAAALRDYIEAAEKAGTNLQIMSAMYWSNSPYSPDGLGGNFADLKYSQVLYNSALGLYSPTTPNVYSSTQWVTTGSSVLNQAAVSKIKDFFSTFADSLSFLRARGGSTQAIDIVMEWGVCYKGFATVTGYSDFNSMDGADFHPELVAAAKEDGVILDPVDGLSKVEKRWLTDWHAAYNQMLADAYNEALGTDAVLVNGSKITLPTTQTADHIFAHNVQWINQNPSWGDLTISGWQSGVGDGFYSSSEDMWFDPVRFYQYKASYGRTGCVNLEMAIHNPKGVIQKYVRQAYQNGLEFVTLFNDKSEYATANNLRDIDKQENNTANAPEHFDVNILDVDVMRDAADQPLKNAPSGVTYENFTLDDGKLVLTDPSKAGVITLELSDGETFDNGLYIDVYAIMGNSGKTEVYAGASLDTLQKLGEGEYMHHNDRFNSNITTRYDFSAQSKGKDKCFVQIRVLGNGGSPSVRGFKVCRPFAQTTGQLNGMTTTLKQARLQSLWVSQQAVTLNQYEDYLEKSGKEDSVSVLADKLIAAGYYKTAYTLLAGEISQVLPAKYLVTGSGTLGKYPVSVQLKKETDCLQIVLTKVGSGNYEFSLVSEKVQSATMEFSGLNNSKKYELTSLGDNKFALKETSSGTLKPTDGKVSVTVKATTASAKKLTTVSGRAYSNGGGSTIKVTVQDPAISNYSQYVEYMISGECVYTRRADGSSETTSVTPRAGDYVTLTFNENNMVVKCESVYGDKTGVIKSFTKPSVEAGGSNGIIEFTDGTRFELENLATTTSIQLDGKDLRARTRTPDQLAAIFTAGKEIRITYCPESYNGALPRVITVLDP